MSLTAEPTRRHDIDALRVLAFGLLILYHVCMFYVADWGWHVKSVHQAEWLKVPMLLINQWRMPLIFMVSGLAVNFIWGKYKLGQFVWRRFVRLMIPLVFAMATIIAPQCYYEALNKGIIEPGFIQFMKDYWTFQDFPGQAWAGENEITWTWNHLWFLPYLFLYTLVLVPVAVFLDGPGRKLRLWFCSMRHIWLILLPVVPFVLYSAFVFPSFPYISHALFDDWYAHAVYGTCFLFGYLVGRDAGLWAEFARLRTVALALAIVMFIVFISSDGPRILVRNLNGWLWLMAVLGWGHHLMNRPAKWITYGTEAVYPWYILHQTITVVVGYNLSKLALGPSVEPLLLLAATIGGCYVGHEFIIRRVRILRPLFGLK